MEPSLKYKTWNHAYRQQFGIILLDKGVLKGKGLPAMLLGMNAQRRIPPVSMLCTVELIYNFKYRGNTKPIPKPIPKMYVINLCLKPQHSVNILQTAQSLTNQPVQPTINDITQMTSPR